MDLLGFIPGVKPPARCGRARVVAGGSWGSGRDAVEDVSGGEFASLGGYTSRVDVFREPYTGGWRGTPCACAPPSCPPRLIQRACWTDFAVVFPWILCGMLDVNKDIKNIKNE